MPVRHMWRKHCTTLLRTASTLHQTMDHINVPAAHGALCSASIQMPRFRIIGVQTWNCQKNNKHWISSQTVQRGERVLVPVSQILWFLCARKLGYKNHNESLILTFMGPCIVRIIYTQTRYNVKHFILSRSCSTRFGCYHHPSSGAQTTVSIASGICHTVTAACRYRVKSWKWFECTVGGVHATHSTLNLSLINPKILFWWL